MPSGISLLTRGFVGGGAQAVVEEPDEPVPIEAPLEVAGVEAIDHVTDALARLPYYLARLP